MSHLLISAGCPFLAILEGRILAEACIFGSFTLVYLSASPFFSHSGGRIHTEARKRFLLDHFSFIYLRVLSFINHRSEGGIHAGARIGVLTVSLPICLSARYLVLIVRKNGYSPSLGLDSVYAHFSFVYLRALSYFESLGRKDTY